jgi:hypothetical protein
MPYLPETFLKGNIMMNTLQKYFSKGLLAVALFAGASAAWAQVSLGNAADFAVLGGSNVTCTAGVIAGDVGVAPGSAVPFTNTGCTITGLTPPATDAAAVGARVDFLNAYASLWSQSNTCVQLPGNLADQNLAPGVYCLDAVAKAGTLTLTGAADGVWVFLVNGALTATDFNVVMAGGAEPCNVYWAPTAAATLTTSAFKGSILAGNPIGGSVTLTGGSFAGQVMANVAVTMTGASVIGCDTLSNVVDTTCKKNKRHHDKKHEKCNQGVGNGPEACDPGHSNHHHSSNDEDDDKRGHSKRK